ncbi:hypothetical protein AJ87_08135 [Rhizobium yanglingense]|nr:hypothetical protein AJ87_08135 [Rhizobium yanglingense]
MTTTRVDYDKPDQRPEAIALEAMVRLGLDAAGADCESMAGGLMNHTVRIRSAAGDHCVRLRPDSLGPSSQLFAAERWALPLAEQAGLNCARLLGTIRIETGPGWSVAVFETVEGTQLDRFASVAADTN